jgi:hypothetical protein
MFGMPCPLWASVSLQHCDDPPAARRFGRIVTSFLEDWGSASLRNSRLQKS